MKGRLLSYKELVNLKDGTKVWVEDLEKYYTDDIYIKNKNKLERINEAPWDIDTKDIKRIRIYEWTEISQNEQTITKESAPKTYKGSEILAMIEDGRLNYDDIIIAKKGTEFLIKDVLYLAVLVDLSPFTIKQKPVDFMTAVNSGKNIRPVLLASEKKFHSYIYWLGFMVSGCAHHKMPADLINDLWELEF